MHAFTVEGIDGSERGVGTQGTKTVKRPSSNSSMMKADTSASSISANAGFQTFS
jgi:hypothetical protein